MYTTTARLYTAISMYSLPPLQPISISRVNERFTSFGKHVVALALMLVLSSHCKNHPCDVLSSSAVVISNPCTDMF